MTTSPESDAGADLGRRARLLLAKYEGRSTWVGFEQPRREAWAEIERDLRWLADAPLSPGVDQEADQ